MVRIVLIHAVQAAMSPIETAFQKFWPDTDRVNFLDDSLARDRGGSRGLTPELSSRIMALSNYAMETGARGVLFTCSAFGDAIESAAKALPRPVLKPNEAMFEEALDHSLRIGMLATFEPAVSTMEEEFYSMARQRKSRATLETLVVPGARDALNAGDLDTHDELIAKTAGALGHCDAILLAHFSMATAEERVQKNSSVPVYSAPSRAVLKLRRSLAAQNTVLN